MEKFSLQFIPLTADSDIIVMSDKTKVPVSHRSSACPHTLTNLRRRWVSLNRAAYSAVTKVTMDAWMTNTLALKQSLVEVCSPQDKPKWPGFVEVTKCGLVGMEFNLTMSSKHMGTFYCLYAPIIQVSGLEQWLLLVHAPSIPLF